MNSYTPERVQGQAQPHLLKEKLKLHIKHELSLGEKVIALLKQKKLLETRLHEQLVTKETLEQQLGEMTTSKQQLEQEFLQVQEALRRRQTSLQRKSQRIAEHENDSRGDLNLLRQEIAQLKRQLDILDRQKVEEHVRLSNKIKELTGRERTLQRELQKISYQKELVEEELHTAQGKLNEISGLHHHQHHHYQEQIELLESERSTLEDRIAQILEERQKNEQILQREVESLRVSKMQMEEKLGYLERQVKEAIQQDDTDLLRVIEKQDQYIRKLREDAEKIQEKAENAHQRSAMLRAENENLQKKLQTISATQEKISWENKILETSIKGLQNDLVGYAKLKNEFEKIQSEKKSLETSLYHHLESFRVTAPKTQKVPTTLLKTSQTLRESWGISPGKLAVTVLSCIVIILAVIAYTQFPSYTVPTYQSSTVLDLSEDAFEQIVPMEIEWVDDADGGVQDRLPENPKVAEISSSMPDVAGEEAASQTFAQPASSLTASGRIQRSKKQSELAPVQTSALPVKADEKPLFKTPRPVEIVVQLPDSRNDRFLRKSARPFPTIENNIVLRRHYEQKL